MASTEYIKKRLDGKKAALEKLEKKMERIKKAEATGWEVNPYYYNDYDLKRTARDIEEAKDAIAKYEADLAEAVDKDNSRNVTAILEFLRLWKERVTKYYNNKFKVYPMALKQLKKDMEPFKTDWRMHCDDPEKYKANRKAQRELQEAFDARFGCLQPYLIPVLNPKTNCYDKVALDRERLDKDLTKEANRKYDFIIERTCAIVGKIVDASNLSVGNKGDLNGYIIGDKGNASVTTIGAGGYNIQCYHFRTLIHPMKYR